MSYKFGSTSRKRLIRCHPDMVRVVERAIQITEQDFSILEGERSYARQKAMFDSGASRTMKGKHLIQPDGYFHALDLAPWLGGVRFEWALVFKVACAMDQAATELGVIVRWGAVWDKNMMQYGGSPAALKKEVDAYAARHPGPDLIDGPHFELVL